RRQNRFPTFESLVHQPRVGAIPPREIGDERARINRQQAHRSSRRASRSSVNLTLPRCFVNSRCAWRDASTRSPSRTVLVTPSPVAFCARSSKSAGTSTVIFCVAAMTGSVYQHGQPVTELVTGLGVSRRKRI